MKNIITICITIFLISCTNDAIHTIERTFNNTNLIELSSEVLETNHSKSGFLAMRSMVYIDGVLIITRGSNDFMLEVVNLETNEVMGFVPKGTGPRGFNNLPVLSVDNFNKKLYALDGHKYQVYDIDSLKNKKIRSRQKFQYSHSKGMKINLLGAVFCGDGLFSILDDYKTFGVFNFNTYELTKKTFKECTSSSENHEAIFKHPNKNRAVLLGNNFSTFSIIDFENENFNIIKKHMWDVSDLIKVNDGHYEKYKLKEGVAQKMAFLHSAVSQNKIYALYSGKKMDKKAVEEYSKTLNKNALNSMFETDLIYVFDWEGNPIERYKLDKNVRAITLDEKTNTLYTSFEDEHGNLSIAKYKLTS